MDLDYNDLIDDRSISNNAGGLQWPELKGPTDIVLIVVPG